MHIVPESLVLPSKPLLGKGYLSVGQAGACLHTMAVLQAYQADLLKELDEGKKVKADAIPEVPSSSLSNLEQPHTNTGSSYRETQKQRAPPD